MQRVKQKEDKLPFMNYLEEIVSGIFLSITVLVVIINVILRYGFNTSLFWVEEVATTCFIWSVFIGVAAAYKHKMHIGIDMIVKTFPVKVQRIISILVDVMMVIINGYIFYLSIIFTRASSIKPTAVLGVSSSWVSASIMVGFGLMTIYAFLYLVRAVKDFSLDGKKGAAL